MFSNCSITFWALSLLFAALALSAAQRRGQRVISSPDIPVTEFSCIGRPPGYYADVETGCQVYHMCAAGGQQFSYKCPNTTLFQQRMLICAHWYQVNCSRSESHYGANLLIGQRDKPFVNENENTYYVNEKQVANLTNPELLQHLAPTRDQSSRQPKAQSHHTQQNQFQKFNLKRSDVYSAGNPEKNPLANRVEHGNRHFQFGQSSPQPKQQFTTNVFPTSESPLTTQTFNNHFNQEVSTLNRVENGNRHFQFGQSSPQTKQQFTTNVFPTSESPLTTQTFNNQFNQEVSTLNRVENGNRHFQFGQSSPQTKQQFTTNVFPTSESPLTTQTFNNQFNQEVSTLNRVENGNRHFQFGQSIPQPKQQFTTNLFPTSESPLTTQTFNNQFNQGVSTLNRVENGNKHFQFSQSSPQTKQQFTTNVFPTSESPLTTQTFNNPFNQRVSQLETQTLSPTGQFTPEYIDTDFVPPKEVMQESETSHVNLNAQEEYSTTTAKPEVASPSIEVTPVASVQPPGVGFKDKTTDIPNDEYNVFINRFDPNEVTQTTTTNPHETTEYYTFIDRFNPNIDGMIDSEKIQSRPTETRVIKIPIFELEPPFQDSDESDSNQIELHFKDPRRTFFIPDSGTGELNADDVPIVVTIPLHTAADSPPMWFRTDKSKDPCARCHPSFVVNKNNCMPCVIIR